MTKEMDTEVMNYLTHRSVKEGNLAYRAIPMSEEILGDRRTYLREILKNSRRFRNVSNNVLDNMLIRPLENGYLAEDENGYEFFVSDSEIKTANSTRAERSLIPKEYRENQISDFDWKLYGDVNVSIQKTTLNRFITRFQEFSNHGMGLYIFSSTKGSGKTMLACILLNEIGSRYDINTKFVTSTDYLNMTKRSYKGNDDEINMIRRSELLVIDDIGTQLSRDWIDTTFYELVNFRYNNKLLTIYTSNIPVDSLKMDERVTDRIDRTTMLVKIPEKPIRRNKGLEEKRRFQTIIEKPCRCCPSD